MNAGSRGFTLLELLVVLAVVSLLVGVTLPHLRFGGVDARTAAQEVSSDLALARSRALATGRPALFAIDASSGHFGIDGAMDHSLPEGIAVSWTLAPGQVAGHVVAVTFFPDGGSTGGLLVLSGRGRDAKIEIDWLVGSVRHD